MINVSGYSAFIAIDKPFFCFRQKFGYFSYFSMKTYIVGTH